MIKTTIALIPLLLTPAVAVYSMSLSSFSFEASIGQKYENNLLSDWTQISDFTSTGHFAVKAYPFPKLELSGSIDRNLIRIKENTEPGYDTIITGNFNPDTTFVLKEDLDEVLNSLSAVNSSVNLTWIPTAANSRFSVYITGGIGRNAYDDRNTFAFDTVQYLGDTTVHKRDFKIYNTTDYNFTAAFGYQYSPGIHLRSQIAVNHHEYTNAFFLKNVGHSNRIVDAVLGGNWSIIGSFVMDMESGFSVQTIERTYVDTITIVDTVNLLIYDVYDDGVSDLRVGTVYLSPRFSLQLNSRTGINVTGTYRHFVSGSDIIVAGETAVLLDPFAVAWEGHGATINVKSYLIPRLITNLSVGYWDKKYLQHEELRQTGFGNYVPTPVDRNDIKKSIYLGFQMPMPKSWGNLTIEPVFSIEYSDNSSTIDRYDYFRWVISLGVAIRR